MLVIAGAVLAGFAPSAAAAAAARVHQMVVFRSGSASVSNPSMAPATVSVGRRRCAVGGATPLAALVHSGVGPLAIHDYGSCSNRPADAGSLFVRAIGADRNRGSDGWVYKVGNRLGTAGAADPSGPFGRGRLRDGAWITWFWCHVTARDNGCPHTLTVAASVAGRTLTVDVLQWSDAARGGVAGGAVVHVGRRTVRAGANGVARLTLGRGRYSVWATQPGRVRSFPTGVHV